VGGVEALDSEGSMNHIKRVTKNTTTVEGSPYGDGRTDCCGAVTTYHDHDLCCAACYREVVHQDELVGHGN
jgi:acyl-coenzyme A thioesterase PaaI-like protein